MMRYRVVEGIDTADIAYKIYGQTLDELFIHAAEAVTETMVDTAKVLPLRKSNLQCQNLTLENLLLDFLNEIVYLKDGQRLVFSKFKIKVKPIKTKSQYFLKGEMWGEKIDPQRHSLRIDVKAVTSHRLEISKKDNFYTALIVLDI